MPRNVNTGVRAGKNTWVFSREQELKALHEAISVATRAQDFVRACNEVVATVKKFTGYEMVAIKQYLADRNEMQLVAQTGFFRGGKTHYARIPREESVSGVVVRSGRPLIQTHFTRKHGSSPLIKSGARTLICVPLKVGEKVIGTLSVASKERRTVPKNLVQFLSLLGREVAWLIDRKRADDFLKESEEKYRQLVHGVLDTIIIVDLQTAVILDVNALATRLTGYKRSELIGKPIFSLHPEEEQQIHIDAFEKLRKHGQVKNLGNVHYLNKNGKSIPAEINARVVTIGGRDVVVGISRDITEQKKADVKLAASEELLRLIVEGTPDMFFYVHDTKGILTYVSPSVEKVTGHSVEEWKDHYFKFATPNPINEQVKEYTERTLRDGTVAPPYLCEIYHADGSTLLIEIQERPIFKEGKVIGIQGVARDITERKMWEENLLKSEEKYRTLFNSVRDGIFKSDVEGRFTSINASGAKILGFRSPEELLGLGARWVDFYTNEVDKDRLLGLLQEQGFIEGFESSIRRHDGEVVTLEGSGVALTDQNGNLTGYDGTFRDITDKKRLEEQLIQSQRMESIGLLAGGIAHDFNNILGAILGYASYLKTTVSEHDKIFTHLQTIERSALRAAELTSQLLAFARRGKYVVTPIDLNSAIKETARLLRGSVDKSILIEEKLGRDIPSVEADAGQIQQVLMNLCVNARDAMPNGGTLTVSSRWLPEPDAFLASQQEIAETGYVQVTIADTGVGIDRTILPRIFEPFFTTKEKGKGTGLGLATVYGIVKNHGGFIDVRSRRGVGSKFIVYLPTVTEPATVIEIKHEEPASGKETVLVVDDEEAIRSLVKDALELKGYKVLEASNGKEALRVYESHGPEIDLVILDMAMPEMGGRETFVNLKEQNKDVKVILSTGYSVDDRAREVLALGARAFIQKPYRVDELGAIVRKVLDNHTKKG